MVLGCLLVATIPALRIPREGRAGCFGPFEAQGKRDDRFFCLSRWRDAKRWLDREDVRGEECLSG
jgi:hypothetical protein